MSASNDTGSGNSMEWGRGRSSGSRKDKRGGNTSSDKPRQPQRGLGVAQVEKIRLQSEMAAYLHHPLGQPPPIPRTGSFNSEEPRLSLSLSSSSSSPFDANIGVPSPIHHPNLEMAAYGERSGDVRYGAFQTNTIIRAYQGRSCLQPPGSPDPDGFCKNQWKTTVGLLGRPQQLMHPTIPATKFSDRTAIRCNGKDAVTSFDPSSYSDSEELGMAAAIGGADEHNLNLNLDLSLGSSAGSKTDGVALASNAPSCIFSSPEDADIKQFAPKETVIRVPVDDKNGGIVGRASEKRDIMELIMSHEPSNRRFTIICIVGGQGIGKTTVASLVYWDNAMCRSFETRAWICSSDVCDYEGLLGSVVESITGVSCRLSDRDELEELVREELTGKKFLLVLDDLHDNNAEICTPLAPLLSVGEKGSAVMVTTSSDKVLGCFPVAYAYYLKPMAHHEFLDMVTPDFVDYSSLESIIKKISSECSGFPMFAKAIYGILYSAFTRECLYDTVDSKLVEIFSKPDNHLHHLLDLSYSYLSPNQKMCFLYCSMFPRDYIYNKAKLLRLWMSQGFIVQEREKDGYGDCEDAFDELLRRSFFDHHPSSNLNEQKYRMHEFSSHLALLASANKFYRAHDHELHCIPQDVHHLSIVPRQFGSEIHFNSFTGFRELSTLLLVCKSQMESFDSQFHVMDIKALDECFRNFRCLKTLDLSQTDLRELPESIGYVSSLCFLGLNNTNLRGLPNSVCNLFNLQTLELKNSTFLVELPNDIKNLTSLYHLDASKEHGPIYVPPGIGQLINLQTLTTFTVGGVSWNCKLSELSHLNSLKGCLHIGSLNNVENAEDANRACLATKKLKKLSLEWCPIGEIVESDDRICAAEHVLDALKPHLLLEELNIKGYYALKFPSWMADHTLSDLVSITLDNCYNCVKLPTLGTLPGLRFLFIKNLRGVQVITFEFCSTDIFNRKSFPKLETLKLCDMYSLEGWYDMLNGDFPSLRRLSIERCPKLTSIPRFQFVSEISIMSCSKLNLLGLQSLETLKVGNLKDRKRFALQFEMPSLVMLEFIRCEHLCSLDGLSRQPSLKHLKFRTCPRLNFVQDEPLPGTLETVDVHSNCYALRNWRPDGFEELPDASEVYRKFIRQKCEDKGVDGEMMKVNGEVIVAKPCRPAHVPAERAFHGLLPLFVPSSEDWGPAPCTATPCISQRHEGAAEADKPLRL